MKAQLRCGAAAIALAGAALSLAAGPASAADAQGAERQRRWWTHAREVLFTGVELRADQAKKIDAMIEGQLETRARLQALGAELRAARERQDTERVAALREERPAIQRKLEGPDQILEQIRGLLDEGQRPAYDMNRARLLDEGRKRAPRDAGAKPSEAAPPGADAGGKAE